MKAETSEAVGGGTVTPSVGKYLLRVLSTAEFAHPPRHGQEAEAGDVGVVAGLVVLVTAQLVPTAGLPAGAPGMYI